MIKALSTVVIAIALFFIHSKLINPKSDTFFTGTSTGGTSSGTSSGTITSTFQHNAKISRIIDSLKYIKKYNDYVYTLLIKTVDDILTLYYTFIDDKPVNLNDISFYKEKLANIYEEIRLNLPFKYHRRLRLDLKNLNKELDMKMDLITLKSFKNPIKLSLMNYNTSTHHDFKL